MTHSLTYTGHTHEGPGQHRVTAECSCGRVRYETTAVNTVRAHRNIREQHKRHERYVREAACSGT